MDLQAEFLTHVRNKNIIVFDGDCVLCSAFFKFVLKHDRKKQFYFAIAQSQFGEALYAHYDLKQSDYDTNLVFIDGKLYERLHSFFQVMRLLGYPWKMVSLLSILPEQVLDWAYYKIARNRYRLFGRRTSCFIPGEDVKSRFIDG